VEGGSQEVCFQFTVKIKLGAHRGKSLWGMSRKGATRKKKVGKKILKEILEAFFWGGGTL